MRVSVAEAAAEEIVSVADVAAEEMVSVALDRVEGAWGRRGVSLGGLVGGLVWRVSLRGSRAGNGTYGVGIVGWW